MRTNKHPAVLAFRQQLERTREGLKKLDVANERARESIPPPKKKKNGKKETERPPELLELHIEE